MKSPLQELQKEYIWQLMCKKVVGIISPKDLHYLESQLSQDAFMREALNALEFAISTEKKQTLEDLINDKDWGPIFSLVLRPSILDQAHQRTILVRNLFLVVGLTNIVILSVVFSFFYWRKAPEAIQPKTATTITSKQLQLVLSDNRIVTLSGEQSLIDLGEVQLRHNKQGLSFRTSIGAVVPEGQHILTVPVGRNYKVTLADSTEVWLNAASQLQFPFGFGSHKREITLLAGEAYVKVAPIIDKPFVINLPESIIQVLGTEFNINTYEQGLVKVSLVSGRLKMNPGNKEIVLKPGMEVYCRHGRIIGPQPFDQLRVLSWRSGKHFFVNATLLEVCTILERNFGINTVVDSGSLAYLKRFSGVLNRNRCIQEFIEVLEVTTGIHCNFDSQGILHFK